MVMILETDTLESLLRRLQEQEKADQKEAFNRAKTNLQRLFIKGVICTPDDEMAMAYRWSNAEKQAAEQGRPVHEVLMENDHLREINRLRDELAWIVKMGETRQEHANRIQTILAATPRLIKGCRHGVFKNWEDWGDVEDVPRVVLFKCSKCKAESRVHWNQSSTPTAQARLAANLLGV